MKKTHLTVYIVTSVVVTLSVLIIYFNFFDGRVIRRPIDFKTDPMNISVDKEQYKRGELVKGHLSFCKKRNIPATVQWTLIDGVLTIYPTRKSTIGKGCRDVEFNIQEIPNFAEIGDTMHFEGMIQYQVNPFSVVSIPLRTNEFKIYE